MAIKMLLVGVVFDSVNLLRDVFQEWMAQCDTTWVEGQLKRSQVHE